MPKKQKDGRYRAKVTPAPGEKPVYVSARTLRELNEKKQYVLTHYRDGLKPRDITFQALVVEWFEVIKRPRIRSRSTLQNYRNIINAHVLPYFPPQQLLRAVRRADLQRCLDACAGMSSIIGSLTRSVLVHAVRYALTENLLDVDISAALMLPQSSTAQVKTAFTPEEEERLLRTAASSPDGLMIYLLYYLGCRRGEMLGLQWGDFDWHTRMVHIQRSVDFNTGKSSVSTLGPTKTSTGDRWVPVPDDLAEILLPLRGLPQTLLISDQGAPLTSNKFRTRWAHLMHAAGFLHLSPRYQARRAAALEAGKPCKAPNISYDYDADITPHSFRHNYITCCVTAGIPAEVTMRIVGHRDYSTTINIYTHLQNEQTKRAAVSLSGVLRSAGCQKVAILPQP